MEKEKIILEHVLDGDIILVLRRETLFQQIWKIFHVNLSMLLALIPFSRSRGAASFLWCSFGREVGFYIIMPRYPRNRFIYILYIWYIYIYINKTAGHVHTIPS